MEFIEHMNKLHDDGLKLFGGRDWRPIKHTIAEYSGIPVGVLLLGALIFRACTAESLLSWVMLIPLTAALITACVYLVAKCSEVTKRPEPEPEVNKLETLDKQYADQLKELTTQVWADGLKSG